jgi:hypothetical protein
MDTDGAYMEYEPQESGEQERKRLLSSLSRAESTLATVRLQADLLRERCAGLEKQVAASAGAGEREAAGAVAAAEKRSVAEKRAAAVVVANAKAETASERKRVADLAAQLDAANKRAEEAARSSTGAWRARGRVRRAEARCVAGAVCVAPPQMRHGPAGIARGMRASVAAPPRTRSTPHPARCLSSPRSACLAAPRAQTRRATRLP